MSGITTSINDFNKNKFQVRFSNCPNMTGYDIDMHVLDNYVKNFQIPDISIPMLNSIYMDKRQLHPNTIGTRDFQTINIEFKIDEELKNWYIMYSWIYNMRHGQTCGKVDLDNEELVRLDCIDTIELVLLNNNNKITSKMLFNHCILTNISALELRYGESDICTFLCTFEIEDFKLKLPFDEVD